MECPTKKEEYDKMSEKVKSNMQKKWAMTWVNIGTGTIGLTCTIVGLACPFTAPVVIGIGIGAAIAGTTTNKILETQINLSEGRGFELQAKDALDVGKITLSILTAGSSDAVGIIAGAAVDLHSVVGFGKEIHDTTENIVN